MKIETVEVVPAKRFEPVGINITFESEEELRVFWAMTNTSLTTLSSNSRSYPKIAEAVRTHYEGPFHVKRVVYGVFTKIDDILEERGLKD